MGDSDINTIDLFNMNSSHLDQIETEEEMLNKLKDMVEAMKSLKPPRGLHFASRPRRIAILVWIAKKYNLCEGEPYDSYLKQSDLFEEEIEIEEIIERINPKKEIEQ